MHPLSACTRVCGVQPCVSLCVETGHLVHVAHPFTREGHTDAVFSGGYPGTPEPTHLSQHTVFPGDAPVRCPSLWASLQELLLPHRVSQPAPPPPAAHQTTPPCRSSLPQPLLTETLDVAEAASQQPVPQRGPQPEPGSPQPSPTTDTPKGTPPEPAPGCPWALSPPATLLCVSGTAGRTRHGIVSSSHTAFRQQVLTGPILRWGNRGLGHTAGQWLPRSKAKLPREPASHRAEGAQEQRGSNVSTGGMSPLPRAGAALGPSC